MSQNPSHLDSRNTPNWCVPDIQSLAGASTLKSTPTGIEKFPVASLKGRAVPHQSHSRHTTRRRRSACATARNIHMKLVSQISLSLEEAAGPRSNRRRLARQDDVRILTKTEPRHPLQRQPRLNDLMNQIFTQSRLRFKTLRLNKRSIPLYSLTTPRHNSHR